VNDTVFYILGLALVALALIASFAGLRFEKFPATRPLLIGGIAIFALLVLGTATFAWRNAEDEQTQHEAELAEATEQSEAAGNAAEAGEEEGSEAAATETTTGTAATQASAEQGAQVFEANGCGGCHTLAAAGSSGTTGPNLDGALKGESTDFIETSITDPNKVIAKGYPPNVMPQTFGEAISPEDLAALVQYLAQSTGAKG
jgi:mono/diheme cytochrome c family protein